MLFASSLFAQAPSEGPLRPAELVQFHKNMGQQFTPVNDLLQVQTASLRSHPEISAEVSKAILLDFDQQFAQRMAIDAPDFITLRLPFEQGVELDVELVKVNIFAPNFAVTTSDPVAHEWEMGTYYRGVIKDMEGSIAAVSIFDGEVRGMFSAPRVGNYTLGALQNNNAARTHIIFNDANLNDANPFECGTPDDGGVYTSDELNGVPNTRALTDCINIYYEVDYDIYQGKGSGTTAFITGNFNEVATLYANENLNYALSQVNVITASGSAYTNQSSSGMLNQFKGRYNGFNGDMAHMVSYKSSGGIAAGFAGLCNSNPDNSMCFSNINSTYSSVPTYSWNIMVQTHEMGHLNGSRHTHACVWNGNNTAIDGCSGQTEGSCALPGFPSGGGTMMSYCHIQSVGINFSNGFGPQPGNVIRSATTNASCLSPCGGGGGGNPCDNPIATFPYNEGFENTLGDWSQGTGDDLDWTLRTGGTPSSGTGPSAASQGSYYVYVEASSPNYPSKTTYLNSPCFNLSGQSSVFANFQYHMIGTAVGTLSLQASDDDGTTWSTVWSLSGAQGTDWNSASVNLSSYGGGNMLLRFNGTTGSSWSGDLCVDDFELSSTGGGGGGGSCTANVSSYPYSEGFESGTGLWSQGSGDDLDWTRDSGGTPSTGTGPSTGAGSSTWYMYVEASSPNYPSKVTYLNGPCFDLSGETSATFTYSYHMYSTGAANEVGTLDLQASDDNGATWTSLGSISGSQGNVWNNASVNMNAYLGGTVQVRFVGTTAATWRGDIAVDNVGMNDSPGGGGCTTVDISITLDNYPGETSWTITDAGGATVASGGTYSGQPAGSTVTASECLNAGCYNFNIFDSYGDGICCAYGSGSYTVTAGGSTVASGGSFTTSESTNFCVGGASMPSAGLPSEASAAVRPMIAFKGFNIFPNPARSILNVGFDSSSEGQATLTVTDLTGKIMLRQDAEVNAGQNQLTLQVRDLAQGSYFLILNNGDVKINKRFVIMK